jgi:hypothetical protein
MSHITQRQLQLLWGIKIATGSARIVPVLSVI